MAQESFSKREARTMATDLIPAFLTAAAETRFGTIFTLAFHTGCRPGELLALTWKDVDSENKRIHIRQTITFIEGGKWYTDEPKTAYGRRTLRLEPETMEMMTSHRKKQLEERMRAGKMWNDHGFIFCDEFGNPYSQDRIRYYFKQVVKAAGLPGNFSPYSARHSAATMMAEQGVHPKAAASRLGHSDATITLNIYTRTTEGMDGDASEMISKAIKGKK
jgi:integrase